MNNIIIIFIECNLLFRCICPVKFWLIINLFVYIKCYLWSLIWILHKYKIAFVFSFSVGTCRCESLLSAKSEVFKHRFLVVYRRNCNWLNLLSDSFMFPINDSQGLWIRCFGNVTDLYCYIHYFSLYHKCLKNINYFLQAFLISR